MKVKFNFLRLLATGMLVCVIPVFAGCSKEKQAVQQGEAQQGETEYIPVEIPPTFQIAFLTDEVQGRFEAFDQYVHDEYGEWIVIWADIPIDNLDFISVGFTDDLFAEGIWYSTGEMRTDKALMVKTSISEGIPTCGISFSDIHDNRTYYYISESGFDGSLVLVEFQNTPVPEGEIIASESFPIEGTTVSGAFDGVITAQVENSGELNYSITDLCAQMNSNGGFDEFFSLSGAYTDGDLTVTLPESLDVILARITGYPDGVYISDRNTRSCSFSAIIGLFMDGSPAASFRLEYDDGDVLCYASYWYVDRDVTLYCDNNKEFLMDLNLKTGWNRVYVISGPSSHRSTTDPSAVDMIGLRWQFKKLVTAEG